MNRGIEIYDFFNHFFLVLCDKFLKQLNRMGLFSGLFKKTEDSGEGKKVFLWIPLTDIVQLEAIEEKSRTKPQLIFKHSTSCGISRMVIRTFADTFDFSPEQIDIYYLDLHDYRQVSDEVGYRFQVRHQSPQVLVLKNGEVVAHDSHGGITQMDFTEFV